MSVGDTDWPTLTEVHGAHERIGKNYSLWTFGSLTATGAALITPTGVLCRKDAAAGWPACQNGAIKKADREVGPPDHRRICWRADLRSAELTAEARSAFSISPHMFSTKHTGGTENFCHQHIRIAWPQR